MTLFSVQNASRELFPWLLPPALRLPPSRALPGAQWKVSHRPLQLLSDSSPLLVGQLLSSESSPHQPGVMSLTQTINPTHSLSLRDLNSTPVHFKDENIFMSPLLKCKYGREHLKPHVSEDLWGGVLAGSPVMETGGQEVQRHFLQGLFVSSRAWVTLGNKREGSRKADSFLSYICKPGCWGKKNPICSQRLSSLGRFKGPETSDQDGAVNSCTKLTAII